MTLVIAATAVVSFTVQNANENRPPNARAVPRWRTVANASFSQWAQTQAQAWENGATPPDDLESWLLDEDDAVFGASSQDLEWWLFTRDGKLLTHQKANARSTSKTLNRDVREIVKRAAQTDRVVASRADALAFAPPNESPPNESPPNAQPNLPDDFAPPLNENGKNADANEALNETLLATSTRSPRGQNLVFVARLPLSNNARPGAPPDAAARRVFPLAGWFLRGEPLTRTLRFVTMLLTAGLFCWWLARHVTRPITQLRATVNELSSGDLAARSDSNVTKRADELGDLGRDFNAMAARLETLVGAQKRLVADVSHELRSPLARLNVALELARRQFASGATTNATAANATSTNLTSSTRSDEIAAKESSDNRKTVDATAVLDRIERESSRLETIVAQLLTISRPDDAQSWTRERVEIRPLLQEIADDVRFEYSNVRIEIKSAEVTILGSRELLRGAIENIVRNAVRFSPDGNAVEITTSEIATDAPSKDVPILRIQIRDHGAGVPTEALPRLFEPFYRVEGARDRKSGGVGLGLAIAQRAVLQHGGTVRAANAQGGGLVVTIELPML